MITNMLGSAVNDNFLKIHTKKNNIILLFLLKKMVTMKKYFIG